MHMLTHSPLSQAHSSPQLCDFFLVFLRVQLHWSLACASVHNVLTRVIALMVLASSRTKTDTIYLKRSIQTEIKDTS